MPWKQGSGPKNSNWKGEAATPESKRERAERRYALGDCEFCGKPATDRHHRNGDLDNHEKENIAILCRRCHMELDGRLKALADRNRIEPKRGTSNPKAKLTESDVKEIRKRYKAGVVMISTLAEAYGVHPTTISRIIHGIRWRHIQ